MKRQRMIMVTTLATLGVPQAQIAKQLSALMIPKADEEDDSDSDSLENGLPIIDLKGRIPRRLRLLASIQK